MFSDDNVCWNIINKDDQENLKPVKAIFRGTLYVFMYMNYPLNL